MKNKNLRQSFKHKNCLVCNQFGCDPCHIRTYATTLHDEPENLVALCRKHHSEQGSIGWQSFAQKYPSVSLMLSQRGLTFNAWGKLVDV